MINYPNGKKRKQPTSTRSASNRGMSLEKEINQSNQYYLESGMANIHKKPTPIQVVNVDYPQRSAAKISEAYFKTPSTTDYNGVFCGKAIDFEAKECASKTSFPFSSIHKHQVEHLRSVLSHGAIAFVIIRFSAYNEDYLVEAQKIIASYSGKRRSIPYSWFQKEAHLIPSSFIPRVDYLKVVEQLYFGGKI
ncbi:MAG: Holliday junction resolvase RecU [Anaerorhabdus sp.]